MSAENSGNIESSPKEATESIPNQENPSQDINSISSELKKYHQIQSTIKK